MDDFYYSKKLDQHFPTRLDILLYAHDGRGLGHASRSIAIGMALRRLYPELRVLFVTGAKISQSLIGNAGLDWIKLPSYASMVTNGVSTGVDGPANFYKSVLGNHRKEMLAQIVRSFKPRCVLVDHSPLGKRKELLQALEESKDLDTRWILGIRAIVGTQKDFWSDEFRDVYQKYYQNILWYGDSKVLGGEHLSKINNHFGCQAKETGYVSRLYETNRLLKSVDSTITGTIAIPWLTENSRNFLGTLYTVLQHRSRHEQWNIFIHGEEVSRTRDIFRDLPHCHVQKAGEEYAGSLLRSKVAIVYGGYNSLMDIFAAKVPAVIVRRDMKDQEQEIHIEKLLRVSGGTIKTIPEEITEETILNQELDSLINNPLSKKNIDINIQGSFESAKLLDKLIS